MRNSTVPISACTKNTITKHQKQASRVYPTRVNTRLKRSCAYSLSVSSLLVNLNP